MDDGDALVRNILLHPEEDFYRLIYADWLDETGTDPVRAEYIRKAVRIHSLNLPDGPCPLGCPCGGDGPWVARAIEDHGDRWNPPLPGESRGEIEFVWGRGFVESVTLPLAAFLGTSCGRCDGSGQRIGADRPFEYGSDARMALACPACHAAGYVGGCAAELFRRHPVTEVRVTDKAPAEERSGWYWYDRAGASRVGRGSTLPRVLFQVAWEMFPAARGLVVEHGAGNLRDLRAPTREDAIGWQLSRACVAHGRQAAGLPRIVY